MFYECKAFAFWLISNTAWANKLISVSGNTDILIRAAAQTQYWMFFGHYWLNQSLHIKPTNRDHIQRRRQP